VSGIITALVAQKRNKTRVNIYIDGSFAFGLAAIEAARLHKGQHLSDADIEALKVRDSAETAYQRALNFLSYRPRSEQEIRQRLREHDVPEWAIDEALARLQRAGLVDDAEFARYWIENRGQFRPRGPRALRYELREKGISDQVINQALADLDADTLAYETARRYLRRLPAHIDTQTFRRKLGNHLARRGFDYHLISEVVGQLLDEHETGTAEEHADYAN
jgi:regulatory protein